MRSDQYLTLNARRSACMQTTGEDHQLAAIRILLVEDEPGLQEAFALVFKLQGYEVLRANDGRDALKLLRGVRPDLIVTDYMLPYVNGAELIKHVRAKPNFVDVPALLMSASLPPYVDISIADAFLPKPVSMGRLLEVSTELVHRGQPPATGGECFYES